MDISIEKAKQIREDIGATHLILFAHAADGSQNVATHGGTEEQAYQAADFGNALKKSMGWPEEFCKSIPAGRIVYQWVDITHVLAFQQYLDHYHDQQDEALEEASNEHYQEWLETCEPGDEYVVSENDHSLDPIEPYFEVVHVDESEHGHHYQLTFVSTGAALHFGLGWGKVLERLAEPKMLEFTYLADRKEASQFGDFLIREASHSSPTADPDGVTEGSYQVRTERPWDMFWLGANWQLYKSKGYDFNAKPPIWSETSLRQLLDNTRAHLAETSTSSEGASPDWIHTLEGRAQGAIDLLEFMLEQGEMGPLNLDYYAKLNAEQEGGEPK